MGRIEIRELTDEDKSQLVSELKQLNMTDLVATHRRLHQMAAQGNTLTGFTKADMEWFHAATEAELKRRAKEDGRDPGDIDSPLEWGGRSLLPAVADRHFPPHVAKIAAKAKQKQKKSVGEEVERRLVDRVRFEVRAEEGTAPVLYGHAAVFDQLSGDLGLFRERIRPGAFADAIRNGGVYGLWNHNPDYPLANTDNGTLRLVEDAQGLQFEMELDPEVTYAADLLRNVRSGRITKMSFGFVAEEDSWSTVDGETVRELISIRRLYDVSPVTFPAYPQTQVSARALSMAEHLRHERDAWHVSFQLRRRRTNLALKEV